MSSSDITASLALPKSTMVLSNETEVLRNSSSFPTLLPKENSDSKNNISAIKSHFLTNDNIYKSEFPNSSLSDQ